MLGIYALLVSLILALLGLEAEYILAVVVGMVILKDALVALKMFKDK